jgi:hypothetical protein
MVGSNRQSIWLDRANRNELENEVGEVPIDVGSVRTDFASLAEEMGWELNKTLLADKVCGVDPGTAWDDVDKQVPFASGRDKYFKKDLLAFQLDQVRHLTGPIDFYFFDDRAEYLGFAREQLQNDGVIPPFVNFFTVHFDWFSHVVENGRLDLESVDRFGHSCPLGDPRPKQGAGERPRRSVRRPGWRFGLILQSWCTPRVKLEA